MDGLFTRKSVNTGLWAKKHRLQHVAVVAVGHEEYSTVSPFVNMHPFLTFSALQINTPFFGDNCASF